MMDKAKVLLHCLGEISDDFLEEAERATATVRKKVIKYSAIGVMAAGGLVLAYQLLRPRLSA